MSDGASERLIQDVAFGIQFNQLSAYASNEITSIHKEIAWRYGELRGILAKQRLTLREIISQPEGSEQRPDALIVVEYPYLALWVHICALQQLQRALNIYKLQRLRWINRFVLRCWSIGQSSLEDDEEGGGKRVGGPLDNMSVQEKQIARRLFALVSAYAPAMIEETLGLPPSGSLLEAIQSASGEGMLVLPDAQFRQRMARLAMVDTRPGVTEWSFDDPCIPTMAELDEMIR